jgi:hypothetical protein
MWRNPIRRWRREFLGAEGDPCEWYGDSAYDTGDPRGAIDDTGADEAVIKPKPLRPPVEGRFTVDDFTVDEQAGAVSCSAGNVRPISKTRVATFGAVCRGCPCGRGAPRPRPAVKSFYTNETTCSAKHAVTGPTSPSYVRGTGSSGPTCNGSSPRSPVWWADA